MRLLAAFIVVLLLGACTHQYKYYDYADVAIPTDDGVIHIFARGNFKQASVTPETTERANPYYFVIAFETSDKPGTPVELKVTRLGLASHPERASSWQVISITESDPYRSGKSRASLLVEGVNLKYETVGIAGEVKYNGKIRKFTTSLQPKYSSEWRNNWLDALMSV